MKKLKHIKFHNESRPDLGFDLLKLEELLSRGILDELTQLHKVQFFQILIVTHGAGFHTLDFSDYTYKEGTLLTIRKDQVHKFHNSPNAKGYLLLFTEDFLVSKFSEAEVLLSLQLFNELLTSPKIELAEKDFDEILRLVGDIEREYQEHHDKFSTGIIRSALHMLVIKLFRIKARLGNTLSEKKYLKEYLEFQKLVEEKCLETKTVNDYASLMHCTTKTLNNVCRAIVDKSAKAVIDEIVITQIKRLLLNTPLTVTEIAYTAGFPEPTNLYKYFKSHTNHSPEGFRQAQS